MNRFVKGLNF